jgi:CO/xanthine dehydrogenase FAD-binding subunit
MFARPGLPPFDYVRASTFDQAISLLLEHGPAAKLLMGGTDLFPGLRDGIFRPRVVVDVKHLPGLRDLTYDEEAGLTIGAAVTMNQLASHPDVKAHYPLLAEAANTVASYQIRNRATIGGNLCNASPCADTSPASLLLQTDLLLCGPEGERSVPAGHFFLGPGQTTLQPGELLTALRMPPPPALTAARYLKLGRCRAGDLSLVGVAVLGYPAETVSGLRFLIGLGSVAPVPLRALEAEDLLAEHSPGEQAFASAAYAAAAIARPITDVRGSARYQQAMVRTLTLRGLRDVWAQIKERK